MDQTQQQFPPSAGAPARRCFRFVSLLAAGLVSTTAACGATFTVVNTNSTGVGSLQQAILDANASVGEDMIVFSIPSGGLTIRPTNALPAITDPVTVDGSTQPGYAGAPLIELQGTTAGPAVDGLKLATSNSVIRGLVINRFAGDGIEITNGTNNRIEGCYLGLNLAGLTDQGNTLNGILITNSANNTVGGLAAANRNYIAGNSQSGINLSGALATNNVILGNVIGLNTANAAVANSADGIRVNAPSNLIGGSSPGSRNVISGNGGQGIEITALGTGTRVVGNYIGVDPGATLDRGNSADGMLVYASGVTVGGAHPGEGNLIAGNTSDGMEISGAGATNNLVLGNTIGGVAGVPNSGNGILITGGAHNNVIGGLESGAANLIAFNTQVGISVAAAAANTNNAFRANLIHSNGGIGINLGAAGVTPNDAGDADTGANRQQNFPVLTVATNLNSGAVIEGSLSSTPNTPFELDLYASVLFDPTGHGEGEFYLGSTGVTTDASGNAAFALMLPAGLPGRYLCATATDLDGNTSEFGPVLAALSTTPPATFTVSNTNDSGPGSLRQAILDANAAVTGGRDQIRFEIPGEGPHVIAPLSALPPVADPVILDGFTQSGASANTLSAGNNAVIKVRLDGNSAPSSVPGLTLWSGGNTVRGLAITRFKSTLGSGLEVLSNDNVVEGCFLGVGTDGVTDLGNGGDGVFIAGARNLIGGPAPQAGNLIGGNTDNGVEFSGAGASNNLVLGNVIGGATGVKNNSNGVLIAAGSHDNVIGGLEPGHANLIAFNGQAGISVAANAASINNACRGNVIYSNGGLGIDLGAAGFTANDPGDADTGANRLQNAPLLVRATTNTPADVTITGALSSTPNTSYAVDFFANAGLETSGFGEGQFYLGSTGLTTDGAGEAGFEVTFAAGLPGRFVSATATDPDGNTSEFARWTIAVSSAPSTNITLHAADFVFIVDASSSMGGEIGAVKAGLGSLVAGLNTAQIDARFAIVLFGGPPEVILDFTRDQATTEAAFDLISVGGAVPGVHNNHNLNPEAGLEAIRIVLNSAVTNTLMRNNVGGTGPLAFRPDARKNLILVTDEDSDLPYYAANREPGQTGNPANPLGAPWQAEIDTTAQAVIANAAFLNVLINPAGVIQFQYGNPSLSASDANFLNFDPDATLTNLVEAGYGGSLEAQVLAGGLIARAFNITSVNTTNFIANFFAAKVEEIIEHPLPPPRLSIAALPEAVLVTWPTNALGYLLETNHAVLPTNGWGVLTTNYGVIGTNFAVTNAIGEAAQFYRLHRQ